MTIRAIYFDLGGVIVRTVDHAPRQRQAERLGISLADLVRAVFDNESSRRATLGEISIEEHWANVMRAFGRPVEEAMSFRDEFFSGDRADQTLIDFIRSLRPQYRTGIISNAWPGLREFLVEEKFDDAFDAIIVSSDVGIMKPDPRIYRVALERLGVAPQEAVFLDDFIENVEGAQALGMYAVHFTQPELALEELKGLLKGHP